MQNDSDEPRDGNIVPFSTARKKSGKARLELVDCGPVSETWTLETCGRAVRFAVTDPMTFHQHLESFMKTVVTNGFIKRVD